ncbi:hypothetical protein [Pseudokordiimonas caeni]|uniref:hypothetical protein n=1 Tax=Pseudokordiimonas caeni TaxID=2997908 RepID=UPI0028126D91|nr:hypothetical protein [Pseudokordiimonas caeni]
MNPFEMVAIIVIVVAVAGMVRSHHRTQAARAERPAGPDAETAARLNALEERIRVLERIATDKRSRLSDEIDSL